MVVTILEGFKKFSIRNEDPKEMDLRAATAIRLNLTKNFLQMCMEVQQNQRALWKKLRNKCIKYKAPQMLIVLDGTVSRFTYIWWKVRKIINHLPVNDIIF